MGNLWVDIVIPGTLSCLGLCLLTWFGYWEAGVYNKRMAIRLQELKEEAARIFQHVEDNRLTFKDCRRSKVRGRGMISRAS